MLVEANQRVLQVRHLLHKLDNIDTSIIALSSLSNQMNLVSKELDNMTMRYEQRLV